MGSCVGASIASAMLFNMVSLKGTNAATCTGVNFSLLRSLMSDFIIKILKMKTKITIRCDCYLTHFNDNFSQNHNSHISGTEINTQFMALFSSTHMTVFSWIIYLLRIKNCIFYVFLLLHFNRKSKKNKHLCKKKSPVQRRKRKKKLWQKAKSGDLLTKQTTREKRKEDGTGSML